MSAAQSLCQTCGKRVQRGYDTSHRRTVLLDSTQRVFALFEKTNEVCRTTLVMAEHQCQKK